jgi:DNA-nicking Smr family endonuclease
MNKKNSGAPTLDLHGFVVDDVFDAIDRFIRKNSSAPRVRVMTGKGKGLVRKKAEEYLRLGGFPFQVEKLDNGKPNDGVLVVFL